MAAPAPVPGDAGEPKDDLTHIPPAPANPADTVLLPEENEVSHTPLVSKPTGSAPRNLGRGSQVNQGKSGLYAPDEIVVRVGKQEVPVDLNACAQQAEAFNGVRVARQRLAVAAEGGQAPANDEQSVEGIEEGTEIAELEFDDFPGGVVHFKNIIKYMEANAAEERAAAAAAGELGVPAGVLKVDTGAFHLVFDTDNVGIYLEGAALLRCPRLMRDTVLAPAAKELSSRKVLALLERVLQFTVQTEPPEGEAATGGNPARAVESVGQVLGTIVEEEPDQRPTASSSDNHEEGTGDKQVHQAFCQVIHRLCARLDAVDFKLTAALASGSTWAALEVLRAYRIKVESLGRMNYALQSVTSTVKSFFYEQDKSQQPKQQEWKEHHFALHVFRKRIIESALNSANSGLKLSAEKAMAGEDDFVMPQSDEDDDKEHSPQKLQLPDNAEDDVPEAICDGVTDSTLAGLAGFVAYCDPLQTPPVLAAAMVRALLLVSQLDPARTLFEAVFVRSRKVQAMVTNGAIPVDFLGSVKINRVASIVLRRILSRYESTGRGEFCHLVDKVLLQDFRDEQHCLDLVLSNPLIQDIVVFCRVGTRSVADPDEKEVAPRSAGSASTTSSEDAELVRVRKVGENLFAAAFVVHNGFLPLKEEPDRRGENWPAGPLGVAECPWDNGDLDLPLLQHVPSSEDALHLLRRVLLRGLFRRQHAGVENDVPTTVRLWVLGRWPQCRDAALISEAFGFLSNCWRQLHTAKAAAGWEGAHEAGASRWTDDEESLFKMFSDLEFWRLQPKELLTPWVPPQLLACHIAARCKLLDEQQRAVSEENRSNLAEINRLRLIVTQLFAKLEVVEKRSVQSSQKQTEVQQTLRSLR